MHRAAFALILSFCAAGSAGVAAAATTTAAGDAEFAHPHQLVDIGEIDGFPASAAALKAARRSFGDLPLVMLTRGVSPYAQPGKPQSALNKAFEAENLAIHTEIAALSTRASHVIQNDQPDAIVQAVAEALGRAGY